MKAALVLLVLVSVTLVASLVPTNIAEDVQFVDAMRNFKKVYYNIDDPLSLWKDFQQKYNRTYPSADEQEYRFNVFKSNLKDAKDLNDASATASYGITPMMDLTPEEFAAKYLMNKNIFIENLRTHTVLPTTSNLSIPESFDWRSKHVVTPVYNQGQCGSCWAFSATENIESMWAISGHGLHELSTQQIVDCCDERQYGCNGGYPYIAYECVRSDGGLDYLKDYPYIARNGACHFHKEWIGGKVASWAYITRDKDEKQMLDHLAGKGPLSACVDAANWQYYNGGIVGPSACGRSLDHCILVTGYDLASRVKYWAVRNSWGTGWGVAGYIALEYGFDTCGVAQLVTTAIP